MRETNSVLRVLQVAYEFSMYSALHVKYVYICIYKIVLVILILFYIRLIYYQLKK